MITLNVNNSESEILGLTIPQFKELSKLVSYTTNTEGSYRASFPKRISLVNKHGVFPTGLLPTVKKYLGSTPHAFKDLRIKPVSDVLFSMDMKFTPYSEQVEIALLPRKHHRGIISATTGFGKSICMALMVNALQLRTLIVVPNVELKRQLRQTFTELFGSLDNITIENIDSSSLDTHTNYDVLIIDEAHHVAARTYRQLNKTAWKGIYYRYFFTATPFRSKTEENMLFESIAGQVIYTVDYKTCVEKGYIVPMEAYFYNVPKSHVEGSNWHQVYGELVVNNDARNQLIASLLISLKAEQKSTLCLVKEIKHGKTLSEHTNIHFASGADEDSKDMIRFFSQKKLNSLIGTTGIVGEGSDTKAAEFIVLTGLGKSKNQFIQNIGRGFRNWPGKESCKIILFLDKSHRWSRDHFKTQCAILLDIYGVLPIELN